VRIYRGIEANIIDENGTIDIKEDDIKWGELDIIIVAMHPRCGYDSQGKEKNTEVLLKALNNPYINIIAHPGNPKYLVNIPEVVAAAKKAKVLIEINNSSSLSRPGSEELCFEIAKEVKKQDWMVSLGTDSHISTMLGNFDNALKLIAKAGLTEDNIVNTSFEKIEKYLLKM